MNDGRARGQQLEQMIYDAYVAEAETRRPNGLRPSELGDECERKLWLRYRWADELETFEGRMLRLFDTGHQQEDRLVNDLRRVGATVWDKNPHNPMEQIPVEIMGGHSRGFLDGVATDIPFSSSEYVATEMKTHSSKSFRQLVKDQDFSKSKPRHYAQLQLYLEEQGLEEGLYVAVNKDTDELFFQFVQHDAEYVKRLKAKAERVVHLTTPPPKINKSASFYLCKFCSASDVCHNGAEPIKTCRTCKHGSPITEREREEHGARNGPVWMCNLLNAPLSIDDQKRACDDHEFADWVLANSSDSVD